RPTEQSRRQRQQHGEIGAGSSWGPDRNKLGRILHRFFVLLADLGDSSLHFEGALADSASRMRDTLRAWTEAFETFILQVIFEERRDKAAALARVLLFLLSRLFLIAVKLRRFLYDVRLLRDSTLGVQVIAIGNLTVGGTGKTPV